MFLLKLFGQVLRLTLVAIIAKYGVLINKWGGLYYSLSKVSVNKITLWKKCPCRWLDCRISDHISVMRYPPRYISSQSFLLFYFNHTFGEFEMKNGGRKIKPLLFHLVFLWSFRFYWRLPFRFDLSSYLSMWLMIKKHKKSKVIAAYLNFLQ